MLIICSEKRVITLCSGAADQLDNGEDSRSSVASYYPSPSKRDRGGELESKAFINLILFVNL